MVKYTLGWKHLNAAIHTLAGAPDMKQRLESAIIFNLANINPGSDLPEEIRKEFIGFMDEMHSRRTCDSEGAVWEAIACLDDVGRQRAVTHIIYFYDVVSRMRGAMKAGLWSRKPVPYRTHRRILMAMRDW